MVIDTVIYNLLLILFRQQLRRKFDLLKESWVINFNFEKTCSKVNQAARHAAFSTLE